MTPQALHTRRLNTVLRRRARARRLDGNRCASCSKKVHHDPKAWLALGDRAGIRCLDCRKVFCPRCARKHFAPVIKSHAKIMDAIVTLALKAVRGVDCKQVRKQKVRRR